MQSRGFSRLFCSPLEKKSEPEELSLPQQLKQAQNDYNLTTAKLAALDKPEAVEEMRRIVYLRVKYGKCHPDVKQWIETVKAIDAEHNLAEFRLGNLQFRTAHPTTRFFSPFFFFFLVTHLLKVRKFQPWASCEDREDKRKGEGIARPRC